MKKLILSLMTISLLILNTSAHATFVSGSTGTLGAFNPTTNTVVALPSDGILNYTTINIPSGITVTFTKNAANTPVYMLASGDVVIGGTINISGSNSSLTVSGTGGPGGWDGGYPGLTTSPSGSGLGPGGGSPGGAGGGFGTAGGVYYSGVGGVTYGNARMLPLTGGSGGGGSDWNGTDGNGSGSGGGGAIVVASSGTINLYGSITANGGSSDLGGYYRHNGGGGSGGGIKLVANVITGNGTISATGGIAWRGGNGGAGRIRLEALTNTWTAATDPPYSYGLPSSVFVPSVPRLAITSVGGAVPPATPTGNYNQPDIFLPNTTANPVAVNVSATNIPDGTTVTVRVIPQYGIATSVDAIISGSTATADVNLSTTYSNVVTAQATFTVVVMYYNGEEIDKVRVAATLGGKSETTYITKSGKEIKGELLTALMK